MPTTIVGKREVFETVGSSVEIGDYKTPSPIGATVNFNDTSTNNIIDFANSLNIMYKLFSSKYPTFTDFNADDNLKQKFKKQFSTNKVQRDKNSSEVFLKDKKYPVVKIRLQKFCIFFHFFVYSFRGRVFL